MKTIKLLAISLFALASFSCAPSELSQSAAQIDALNKAFQLYSQSQQPVEPTK
jgi:hypothetical protein